MAKRKRAKAAAGGLCGEISFKPPSPQRMIRMAAENSAHTAMEANPKVKKMRNAIADAIESTIKRHLGLTQGGKLGDGE